MSSYAPKYLQPKLFRNRITHIENESFVLHMKVSVYFCVVFVRINNEI